MKASHPAPSTTRVAARAWQLIEHAFDRTAGAPLVGGNAVRLLRDAAENYPPWLEAIRGAERYIYFESYIIHDDDIGETFADALVARAGEGVRVRLVYDWLGALGKTSRRFWRRLRDGGVEVRCYNPPRLVSPFGWVHRDHRKMLSVDGRVGFVTGLCVGRAWAGDPARGIEPWRDTGVEIRGPAVADVEAAFAEVWSAIGPPLPAGERMPREAMPAAGDTALRVVASTPGTTGLLRLDQLVAAAARQRLWLSDAYFAGIPPYVQALRAAARDGVDVRLLVPGSSDIPLLRPLSQAGFRPLLEAGVRVFEWKGPMMHAKTAVADGRWARVGSSNLNLASWLGNHELDAVVEDARFAEEMERTYLEDLENTTELVLVPGRRLVDRLGRRGERRRPATAPAGGSAGRAAAGALRIGNTVGAAIGDRRVLAPAEATVVAAAGVVLLALAAVAVLWPRVLTIPLAILGLWIGGTLLARAYTLRRARRARAGAVTAGPDAPAP
ncbi:MAG TPA: phospholipase D-like domain-containing protein [Longimicrobiales bacterium]|nr:phospholipase D-like domain-containing protein [Longimicrobiales bacterium]